VKKTTQGALSIPNHKAHPNGRNSFSLAYKTEAINLVDICLPTLCIEGIEWDHNAAQLRLAQDQSIMTILMDWCSWQLYAHSLGTYSI